MSATFGEVLTELRVAAGLSQSKLADKADLDHSYLSCLKSGHRTPSILTVRAISRALGYKEGSPERDKLLQAAGYVPSSASGLLSLPALAALDAVCRGASEPTRTWITESVGLLVQMAERMEAA